MYVVSHPLVKHKMKDEHLFKLNDMFITYTNLKAVKYANNFLALCQCMNT